MIRSIIITGDSNFLKLQETISIASEFKKDEIVYLDYNKKEFLKKEFLLHAFTSKTKLIIIDEVSDFDTMSLFKTMITEPIIVSMKYKSKSTITPKLVLICNPSVKVDSDYSFRRFDVINLNRKNLPL